MRDLPPKTTPRRTCRSRLRRSLAPLCLFALALPALLPSSSPADTLTIDTAQSEATISGTVSLDFANAPLPLGFVPQGTAGATLPSGLQSDGLTSYFEGLVEVDITPTSIRFRAPGRVEVGDSGSWLPGLPGTSGVAAPANAGASFGDATFGTSGNIALRDLRFAITSLELPLTETSQGSNVFEFDSDVALRLTGGARDATANFGNALPRLQLAPPPGTNVAAVGTLELPPGGAPRLTLPIGASNLELGRGLLGSSVTVSLAGQIVATVPEPSPLLCGLAALWSVALLRRRRMT